MTQYMEQSDDRRKEKKQKKKKAKKKTQSRTEDTYLGTREHVIMRTADTPSAPACNCTLDEEIGRCLPSHTG